MFDSKVHVLDHPLLQHKLSILRDERTGVKEFREIVSEIATLECYEATRDLPLEDVEIKTPVATGTFKCLTGKKLAIVPILRAGLGMVDGTRRPWHRWSITARCLTTSPSGTSSSWIPCWLPAAPPWRPSSS